MGFMFIKRDYCTFTAVERWKREVNQPYNYYAFSSSSKSIYQTLLGMMLLAEPNDSHYDLAVPGSVLIANCMLKTHTFPRQASFIPSNSTHMALKQQDFPPTVQQKILGLPHCHSPPRGRVNKKGRNEVIKCQRRPPERTEHFYHLPASMPDPEMMTGYQPHQREGLASWAGVSCTAHLAPTPASPQGTGIHGWTESIVHFFPCWIYLLPLPVLNTSWTHIPDKRFVVKGRGILNTN